MFSTYLCSPCPVTQVPLQSGYRSDFFFAAPECVAVSSHPSGEWCVHISVCVHMLFHLAVSSSAAEHSFYFLICNCRKGTLRTELFLFLFFLVLCVASLWSLLHCLQTDQKKAVERGSYCYAEGDGDLDQREADSSTGQEQDGESPNFALGVSPPVSSVLARQCLVLRHKDPANRTPRHLLQLGNCHVFSLVRLDAFKYVSCLQLSPGR